MKTISSRVVHNFAFSMQEEFSFFLRESSSFQKVESHRGSIFNEINPKIVGNKAKGRTSNWVFQENKLRQIFRKTNTSYSLINTRTCAYHGVINVCFCENLTRFVFLTHPSWDSPFYLITDNL